MTFTRYTTPVLSCDADLLCENEFRGWPGVEAESLRSRARQGRRHGRWAQRGHLDYCPRHAKAREISDA